MWKLSLITVLCLVNCPANLDTAFSCGDAYFLSVDSFECSPCTVCPHTEPPSFEIRPCGKSEDSLCCPYSDMVAVQIPGRPGFTCQFSNATTGKYFRKGPYWNLPENDRDPPKYFSFRKNASSFRKARKGLTAVGPTTSCGKGQFLNIDEVTNEQSCDPCPEGTFMHSKRHSKRRCLVCADYKLNSHDIMGCDTKRQLPILIGCTPGFVFIISNIRYCNPCTRCKDNELEVQECSNETDRLCCPLEGTRSPTGDPRCQDLTITSRQPMSTTVPSASITQVKKEIPTLKPQTDGVASTSGSSTSRVNEPQKPCERNGDQDKNGLLALGLLLILVVSLLVNLACCVYIIFCLHRTNNQNIRPNRSYHIVNTDE